MKVMPVAPVTTRWTFRPCGVVTGILIAGLLVGGCSGGDGATRGGGGSRPTPSPSGTPEPTVTPTAGGPTIRPTDTRTVTPMAAPTATPTRAPAGPTVTPTPTVRPVLTPTDTPTASATAAAPTPSATATMPPPSPTATAVPSPTPPTGPVVTALGIADGSGTVIDPVFRDDEGRPVYRVGEGHGFIVFVEGRPGPSRLPVGTSRHVPTAATTAPPDIQVVSSAPLGSPTTAVCDGAPPAAGGVPAVDPPRFDPEPAITAALNDLACRFRVFGVTDFPCTQTVRGHYRFVDPSSVIQFCALVNEALTFPAGDTVLTARLRDIGGHAGGTAAIVVRVTGGGS